MAGKRTFRQHLMGHLMRRLAVTYEEQGASHQMGASDMHIYIVCHIAGGSIISPIAFFHTLGEAQDYHKQHPWGVIVRMTLGRDGYQIVERPKL